MIAKVRKNGGIMQGFVAIGLYLKYIVFSLYNIE